MILCVLLLPPSLAGEDSKREFDKEALAQVRDDPAFDYSREYAQSGSFLTLVLAYIFQKVASFFEFTGIGWLGPWVFRIVVLLAILFLIYFILRNRYGPIFTRDSNSYIPSGVVATGGEKVDYESLIRESVANSEYKMAIRYLFLKSLNSLNDQGKLEIKHWKAPYDYLKELPGEKKPFFRELAELFEVTWYGEYSADEAVYHKGLQASKQLIQ